MPRVDHVAALAVLTEAVAAAQARDYRVQSPAASELREIITGSHLTYRYILLTALLAKATNPKVNALAIQAQAPIAKPYDARSLCHKVIVPNEAKLLHSALGGSNEPYLNKPARIPFLDASNPVRRGRDKQTLETLCRTISQLDSQQKALAALADSIFYAISAEKERAEKVNAVIGAVGEAPADMRSFLSALLSQTHHGETVVLVVALLYWLLSSSRNAGWTIEVHPVNESGSSSNQVGDVDVYSGQDLIYTCEAKDKEVAANDIHHAIRKAADAQSESLHVILGNSGRIHGATMEELEIFAKKLGVRLTVFEAKSLVHASPIWTASSITLADIAKKCLEFAEVSRMKKTTQTFVLQTIQASGST